MRRLPIRPFAAAAAVVVALAGFAVAARPASAAGPLLSQGRPVLASSQENAGTPATAAVDGNAATRWSSQFSDPQWIRVDLGQTAAVDQVTLVWEGAYARS